jgi:hypothetical protein
MGICQQQIMPASSKSSIRRIIDANHPANAAANPNLLAGRAACGFSCVDGFGMGIRVTACGLCTWRIRSAGQGNLRTSVLYAHTVADMSNHSCGPCNESSNRPMLLWGRPGNWTRDSGVHQHQPGSSSRNLNRNTAGSLCCRHPESADARATMAAAFAGINGGQSIRHIARAAPNGGRLYVAKLLMATLIM